ncbi:MAG TPA: vitamin K epoxide reductase family protein [Gemmatimonadota bacterium]|nr:vitamin K epoxide reductase family protein [Gemmatimonadota bacterium]
MTAAVWTARLLALAGFLDAAYLTAHHYAGGVVACGPGGGCEVVLTSRYAEVGGIPVAVVGLGYYTVASLLAWTPRQSWTRGIARAFVSLEATALAVSVALVWIQATRIHAWCRFCLVSAGLTLLLFLTSLWILRVRRAVEARSLL